MSFIAVAPLERVLSKKFVFDRYRAINEMMGTFVWEPSGSFANFRKGDDIFSRFEWALFGDAVMAINSGLVLVEYKLL